MRLSIARLLLGVAIASALALAGALAVKATQPDREVTTSSAEAYGLYQRGMKQWLNVRADAADSSWAAAVQLDPGFAMAWARRGALAYRRGQLRPARLYLARAESLVGGVSALEKARIRWFRAQLDGDAPSERASINAVLEKKPGDVEALLALFQLQWESGEAEAGVASMQEILRLEPSCVAAYNNMGYALADLGRFDQALEALRKYAFVNSDEPNPHDSLGELYERIGRYQEAEAEYARAIAADSTFFWTREHQARLLSSMGRYGDALEATRQGRAELSPLSRKQLRNRTVYTLLQAGRHDEALEMMDAMRDSLFQPPSWLHCRAEILKENGDAAGVDAMRDSLLQLLATPGGISATWADYLRTSARALSWEVHGNWGTAADSLQAWLTRTHPAWDTRHEVLLRLADDLTRAGRLDEALAATGQVLAENPRQARALCLQARALERAGRGTAAVEAWLSAVRSLEHADPGNPLREEAARRLAMAGAPPAP
jgi:tetratricopeptide (TPR) repeat protein